MCRHILIPNEDEAADVAENAAERAQRTFTSAELRDLDAWWDDERHALQQRRMDSRHIESALTNIRASPEYRNLPITPEELQEVVRTVLEVSTEIGYRSYYRLSSLRDYLAAPAQANIRKAPWWPRYIDRSQGCSGFVWRLVGRAIATIARG